MESILEHRRKNYDEEVKHIAKGNIVIKKINKE